jgi:hypothetical protein
MGNRLTPREAEALRAFEGRTSLRFCELPLNVGQRTMNQLVAKGLIEASDTFISRYSRDYSWKLVRPAAKE